MSPTDSAIVHTMAPDDAMLTDYDRAHAITYLRLLDAEGEGADWRDAARLVLGCDPDSDPECVRKTYDTHLARARWMTANGYGHLLRGSAPH